jgi:hypothetical protein
MARSGKKSDIDFSPECMEAYERLGALAHQLASVLSGDGLSPEGKAETPRSLALVMGMLYFPLRTDPDDLRALFFSEKSLNQIPFKPGAPEPMRHAPLAFMLS